MVCHDKECSCHTVGIEYTFSFMTLKYELSFYLIILGL